MWRRSWKRTAGRSARRSVSLNARLRLASQSGRADARGEDEAVILPKRAVLHPLFELAPAMLSEGRCGPLREPDAPALARLGGLEDPAALRLGERAAYLQRPGFEVYVLPLEPLQFSAPHAEPFEVEETAIRLGHSSGCPGPFRERLLSLTRLLLHLLSRLLELLA